MKGFIILVAKIVIQMTRARPRLGGCLLTLPFVFVYLGYRPGH
jgi:hypothetical protein